MDNTTKKIIVFVIFPLILLAIFVNINVQKPADYELHVHYYDVGQGDSTFIQTASGNQILIDGGPDSSVLQELAQDMPFFDNQIEFVMLSHPHADHVDGLIEVLKRYKVKQIVLPDAEFDSVPYKEFLKLVDEKHITKIYVHEGQRIFFDNSTVFDVYYPPAGHFVADNDYEGFAGNKRNPNDVSIVGKLSFGKTKFLFTGDVGQVIEDELLPRYNLDADVLKVGHHGSKTSSSKEFLDEVTPAYSVIEVGKNNTYGHPTQEALDRLKNANSTIFRTDQNGEIKFTSDGFTIVNK